MIHYIVNTSLWLITISRRRRGYTSPYYRTEGEVNMYTLVINEPEATNCFSINLQVFANNNLLLYKKEKKAIFTGQ